MPIRRRPLWKAPGVRASARGLAMRSKRRRTGPSPRRWRARQRLERWGVLVGVEAAAVLEDLTQGQLGEDAHGQDHPTGDLESHGAAAGVEASGVLEDLQDLAPGDNLLQQ